MTDVVITHMHMDHIGGLLVDEVKNRLRPDVRIHVSATEVDFWATPDFTQTTMPTPVPDVLRSTAQQFMDAFHNQLKTFEDEYEVAPCVVVKLTGGHTPGGHNFYRASANLAQCVSARRDARHPVRHSHSLIG